MPRKAGKVPQKENPPASERSRRILAARSPTSELVAQGYLYLAYRIDDVSGSIGYAEIVIEDIAIQRSEDMPVEGVGDIHL